jgi:hypothetical protein
MIINQKRVIGIIIAVLVVLLAGWLIWKQTAKHESGSAANSTSTTLEQDKDAANELSQSQALAGNTLEGVLRASDNAKKGNLMLVTATNTVYISTNRDYSSLVGKQVKTTYDGTTDDFRLGDIVIK